MKTFLCIVVAGIIFNFVVVAIVALFWPGKSDKDE
jgi:hypothetical protein